MQDFQEDNKFSDTYIPRTDMEKGMKILFPKPFVAFMCSFVIGFVFGVLVSH